MKPLIVANWKMNPSTLAEAKKLFNLVNRGVKNIKGQEVVICPPFLYLSIFRASTFTKGFGGLRLGSQDCFWEEKGAFTGEVSPLMLKNLGCKYVIIGHSERRQYFEESDQMINKKIKAVLKAKLKPIFCIGETQKEKNRGQTSLILRSQIKKGLKKIPKKEIKNIIIAYEPIWAIGTGKACGIPEAKKVNFLIRKIMKKNILLYGGSINSQNARDFIVRAKFQGLLIGGASLKAQEFIKIAKAIPAQ